MDFFGKKGKLVIYEYMRVNGGTNYDSYIKVMVHKGYSTHIKGL